MRTASLGKAACWAFVAVLIGCCFEKVAVAQGRNESVLNRAFTSSGPAEGKGHWVWRDKKQQAPGKGIEAFEAYVRPDANDPTQKVELTIRLYDAPSEASGPIANIVQMELRETYKFILQSSNEANGRGRPDPKNRTFHFILKSAVRNAEGGPAGNGTERLFFITGTGLRERPGQPRNQDRTFRLTTLVVRDSSDPESQDGPVLAMQTSSLTGCSDYPDDAVLEEEVYSQLESADPTTPPSQPDEVSWLTYTW